MPLPPTRQVAVAGVGITAVARRSARSALDLAAEGLQIALDDAGPAPSDVDGLFSNVRLRLRRGAGRLRVPGERAAPGKIAISVRPEDPC
jgi:hypothetical protein